MKGCTEFKFFTDHLINKDGRRRGLNKKARAKIPPQEAHRLTNKDGQQRLRLEEMWASDGGLMINVGDPRFVQALSESKFDLVDPDKLNFYSNRFIINLPRSTLIEGSAVQSICVVIRDFDEENLYHEGLKIEGKVIQILYRRDNEFLIGVRKVKDLMQLVRPIDPNIMRHQMEYVNELARIVFSIMIYLHAMPGSLVPGPSPKRWRSVFPRPTVFNLETALQFTTSTHYRAFHFRQLMHERFYRNEHANEPIGSRIVFVKDSVVTRKSKIIEND